MCTLDRESKFKAVPQTMVAQRRSGGAAPTKVTVINPP
jgi:hypothetical protein